MPDQLAQAEIARLQMAHIPDTGISWPHWAALRLNKIFDEQGKAGGPPSNITPETIRYGLREAFDATVFYLR